MDKFEYLLPAAMICAIIMLTRSVRRHEGAEMAILWIFCLLYAVGKYLGLIVVGPRLIRWYLADVGYIGLVVLPLSLYPWYGWAKAIIYARRAAFVLFGGAWVTEVFILLIQPESIPKTIMARGDVVDLVIYVISYAFIILLLNRLEEKKNHHVKDVPVAVKRKAKKPKRLFRP